MILLALVDKDLSKEEREEIARVLHQTPRKEKSKYGKPVFPVISCLLTPYPTPPRLSTLVTEDTWTVLDRLGFTGPNDWLLTPQNLWNLFTEYRSLESFVKNLPVTNDIAERG